MQRWRKIVIPEHLDGWNLDVVRALVAQGVFETDRFDFKEMPDSRDAPGKERLKFTIAGFANSGGGFIVLGVKNDRTLSVDDRIVGIDPNTDVPERVGAFASAIEPSVDWAYFNPPLVLPSGRLLHIVHVPESQRGPHAIRKDTAFVFPKRTNRGTEGMSYAELIAAVVDLKRRRSQLMLLKSELERMSQYAQRWNIESYHREPEVIPSSFYLERYRTEAVRALIPQLFDDLAREPQLVEHLNDILDATSAADAATAHLAAYMRGAEPTTLDVDDHAYAVRPYARRVMTSTHHAIPLLSKLLTQQNRP